MIYFETQPKQLQSLSWSLQICSFMTLLFGKTVQDTMKHILTYTVH